MCLLAVWKDGHPLLCCLRSCKSLHTVSSSSHGEADRIASFVVSISGVSNVSFYENRITGSTFNKRNAGLFNLHQPHKNREKNETTLKNLPRGSKNLDSVSALMTERTDD